MVQFSFVTLPKDILRGNLLPYLSPRCIAMLDSAVCDQLSRHYYLDAVVGHRVSLVTKDLFREVLALSWLQKRKMFTRSFCIIENGRWCSAVERLKLGPVFRHLDSLYAYGKEAVIHRIIAQIESNSLTEVWFTGKKCAISESLIAALMGRQRGITKLTLDRCNEITDSVFDLLACYCPLLEDLTIRWCHSVVMKNAAVAKLCQACPGLRTIRFVGHHSKNPPPDPLDTIGHYSRNLLMLDFFMRGRGVDDASIAPILAGCPQLQGLNLGGTGVTKAGFAMIAHQCSQLAHLSMDMPDEDTQIAEGFRTLSPTLVTFTGALHARVVELSAPHWGLRMRVLCLHKNDTTDALVVSIARNCPNLTHLTIMDRGGSVSDVATTALSVHTRNMQVIMIEGGSLISDSGVQTLARGCQDLRLLSFSNNTSLTKVGMDALARECPLFTNVLVKSSCDEDHSLLYLTSKHAKYITHFGIVGFR